MIYLLIPEEEIQKIEEKRFDCLDPQISRRLHALYLKSKGYSHQEISEYVGLSLNGLTKIFKKYASGGLEEVKKMHYMGKQSVLDDYREQIRAHFKENPPTSIACIIRTSRFFQRLSRDVSLVLGQLIRRSWLRCCNGIFRRLLLRGRQHD